MSFPAHERCWSASGSLCELKKKEIIVKKIFRNHHINVFVSKKPEFKVSLKKILFIFYLQ